MDKNVHNPVSDDQKPRDHAAKSIKENPTLDATSPPLTTQMWDTRRVNKNDREIATNESHGLNHSNEQAEEGLGMSISKIPAWIEDRDIAIQFLEIAAKDYRNAKDMRVFYAIAARKHGILYREIAEIYGMSTSGVEMMIKRASDANG